MQTRRKQSPHSPQMRARRLLITQRTVCRLVPSTCADCHVLLCHLIHVLSCGLTLKCFVCGFVPLGLVLSVVSYSCLIMTARAVPRRAHATRAQRRHLPTRLCLSQHHSRWSRRSQCEPVRPYLPLHPRQLRPVAVVALSARAFGL